MVEIRVVVTDTAHLHGLMLRLGRLFDRSSVSFDGARREVRVRSEWESRSVVEVIDAVQSWLAADGLGLGRRCRSAIAPTRWPPCRSLRPLEDGPHSRAHAADLCRFGFRYGVVSVPVF